MKKITDALKQGFWQSSITGLVLLLFLYLTIGMNGIFDIVGIKWIIITYLVLFFTTSILSYSGAGK